MFLCSGRMIQVLVLTLSAVASVWGSPLSQERFQITTFGAERRARWSLEGKTAVVTGGTKGIGKAIVEELACLGAKVITCSRNPADVAACLEEWKSKGLLVEGTAADVTTAEGRESLVKLAEEHFGGLLDILVNNVGTNIRKATVDYTPEELAYVMDTNFTSLFLLTKLLHPLLKAAAAVKGSRENGGSSVINISSVAGITPIKSGSPYAASKAAMNQVTRLWGCEWAPDGIRVNAVAPWYTKTPLTEPVQADPVRVNEITQRTPMKRWADADEVSGMVAFLCMKGAGYITSQVIATDGGFTANGWMT
ncbi:tropinone reductase, putative / tropine dehydrogenase, putative [Ectocarpus siliculosus]|uniref:Tropinone reductase, putative / tropine dehydrogenase, putative n=1 Tax=Ectocarpus siliculosus TaxID=2880 RepID=D7FL76_ECTSI|nr:tropinone reductase, putative / tropine dehydrogenase, putative [Ectocarpus siliculosus]|eukprot:CBJ29612.1 tropinone reductase, putative / tropine dehydrogenase, putative [Ectocarpus siliculosus]